MTTRIPIFVRKSGKIGLQEQILEQIRTFVATGQLPLGSKLPSSRALASQLGIARRTATLAYERLAAEGYIEARPASGTFVSRQLPRDWLYVPDESRAVPQSKRIVLPPKSGNLGLYVPASKSLKYDFRLGRPDLSLFPVAAWRRVVSESLDRLTRAVGNYVHPQGHELLRQVLARHVFATRGISCHPDQIVIVAGTQEGLNLAARTLLSAGDTIAMEDPGYIGAANAFQALGARLHPIPLDAEGLCVRRLPLQGVRMVYVTPSHQFPLGMSMSLGRRRALIEWARRTSAIVIEDDYDTDLRYFSSPLPALAAMEAHNVIYIGTFSKSVGPGFRMGYVVMPPSLIEAASNTKSVMSNGHPWLEQAAMARFIESGEYELHLTRMRSHYAVRRNHLVNELNREFPGSRFEGMEGGMHLLWITPDSVPDAHKLEAACRKRGVGIYSLKSGPTWMHAQLPEQGRMLLMAYSALSPTKISEAVALIRRSAADLNTVTPI